jgi:hypothetical protein
MNGGSEPSKAGEHKELPKRQTGKIHYEGT